jgi:hypothetical protein
MANALPVSSTYSDKDYSSNDGMLTTVWGPSMWHYLHTMSFNYPVCPSLSDKNHYRDFVLNLQYTLPCGKCRNNLRKNFKRLPLTMKAMESRSTFSKYIYDLHEVVNKMLHKKPNLTYLDVKERYEHFRARCAKPADSILLTRSRLAKRKNRGRTMKKHVHFAKEKGCTEPLFGEKSKCVLKIVPQKEKCDTFQMDDKCVKKRGPG